MKRRDRQNISRTMRNVRSKGTHPEKLFRKALRASGIRFKGHRIDLPGKPDFVLRKRKLAVFIDGDFWHGGQWTKRHLTRLDEQFRNTRSKMYWLHKIRRNIARDSRVTAELLERGWTVLRFWESDVKTNVKGCLTMTRRAMIKPVSNGVMATLP